MCQSVICNEKIDRKRYLDGIALKLRKRVLSMVYAAGSGHCGGSLSAADIITVLYFNKLNIDPQNPTWEDRDRFIASKGHCAPLLYAALALRGYFPQDELKYFRQMNHFLQGHPDMKRVPGVDMSAGSLGLGLSAGVGMALSARLNQKKYHTFVLLGDGEVQEGQVWEAAMAASKFKVDNLIALLDFNGVQLDGTVSDIMPLGDLSAKWRAFGWNVIEVDGHDTEDISCSIEFAKRIKMKPTIIIAKTVKGKGVSFMEGRYEWHGKPLNDAEYRAALSKLGGDFDE